MQIGLTGASGFIGREVARLAHQRGHEVIAFSRDPRQTVRWTTETRLFSADHCPDLSGCDAVIHLAGEPIVGLWTKAKRERIRQSRVEGTRRVVEAIRRAETKPEVFVCASAIGYYAGGTDAELAEAAPAGDGFLAGTTRAWESAAEEAEGCRVICLRIAVVLGRSGGALRQMLPLFRLGLGATLGSGRQWMSWIHVEDLARLFLFCVEDMSVEGPVNGAAPWPVRNSEFTRALAQQLGRPAFFRIPAAPIRFALGGLSEEVLGNKRVVPGKATEHGFGFRFPEIGPALKDLLG